MRDVEVDKRLKPTTTPIFRPHLIRENKLSLSKCLKIAALRAKGQLWKISKCPDTIGHAISHSKGLRTYTLLVQGAFIYCHHHVQGIPKRKSIAT